MGLLDEDPDEDSDAIRMRNHRIRQHIRHAFIDFTLLSRVSDPAIERVLEDLNGDEDESKVPYTADFALANGIEELFRFLYLHLGEIDSGSVSEFDLLFFNGVRKAREEMYAAEGLSVEHEFVHIIPSENEKVPIAAVKEAFEAGDYLSRSEIDHLFWAGEISYTDREDALEKHKNAIDLADEVGPDESIQIMNQRTAEKAERRQREDITENDEE